MSTLDSPVAAPEFSKRNAWLRRWPWFAGALALIAIYAAVGFFYLPQLARKTADNYVKESLKRLLSIGELRFNPFTFTADVKNIALNEADGSAIAKLDELRVNFELSSLWHRAYTFKQVRLVGPNLNAIVAADGSLNLAALQPPADTANAQPSAVPAVRIDSFELVQGQLHLEDRSRPRPFAATLRPIEFALQNFRTQPGYGNAYHFAATSLANEHLEWSGEFTVQPLGSQGQFTVNGLQAATLAAYLQDSLPFLLQSGSMDLHGNYRVALQERLEAAFTVPDLKLRDARIAPRQESATPMPWVIVPELELGDATASLTDRHLNIRRVDVRGMQLEVQRERDGSINLMQLLGPETAPSEDDWKIDIADIAVQNAVVHAEDRGTQPAARFTLERAALQVKNYSSSPGAKLQFITDLGLEAKGRLQAEGSLQPKTLASEVTIQLTDLPLDRLQPYVAQYTDMLLQGGSLSTRSKLKYDEAAKPKLKLTGDMEIADLVTRDKAEGADFVKWKLLQAKGLDYQQAPDQLLIREINARQPYGRVIIASDHSTNVQQVLRLRPAEPTAEAKDKKGAQRVSNSTPMRTRIDKVLIENGSANFADYSVEPSFATGILKLNGAVTGLSSANSTRAKVKLAGSVDNYAPVSIDGDVNFLAADTYSDLAMNFRNMELTTFNPYSGKFAGYSIAKGKLSTELRYQIRDRKLDAQHHIIVDQLEFGAATDSKDAVPLPIKLAVSLLKDRNGVIDLNLPVGGSLDDPSFRIGPIVWKAFVNLLTKIVTAPFSALGALFGGGEELAFVDFAPGSAALDAEQLGKLATLSKALIERPQLKLDIPLGVVTQADAGVLAKSAFDQALAPLLPPNGAATPQQRLAALTALYQRQLQTAPNFPPAPDADPVIAHTAYLEGELTAHFAPDINKRDGLARARADAVQAALLKAPELSAERVFLIARAEDAKAPEGTVRMELKLDN